MGVKGDFPNFYSHDSFLLKWNGNVALIGYISVTLTKYKVQLYMLVLLLQSYSDIIDHNSP